MVALDCAFGMELDMNKKLILACFFVCIACVSANEFTKKPNRKDKAQQETAYADCVQAIDTLIGSCLHVQQKLVEITNNLYKKIRACAVDDKPEIAQKQTAELREMHQTLQNFEKKLHELAKAIAAAEKSL